MAAATTGTALAALVLSLALAGTAVAASRSFSVQIATAPPVYAGADSATVTATIRNTSGSPQRLGAVRLTFPSVIVPLPGSARVSVGRAAISGQRLELGYLELGPGTSATASLTVRVERCTPGQLVVGAEGKQANEFNGEGNDFPPPPEPPAVPVSGTCTLKWVNQPASAQRGTDITNDVFLPFGTTPAADPATVAVLDGSGVARVSWWTAPVQLTLPTNPGSSTLAGTTTVVPQNGLAAFRNASSGTPGPRIGVSAPGYRMAATSPGIVAPSGESVPFDIVDVGKRCTAGQSCSGATTATKSSASLQTVASAGDILRMSLGAPGTVAPTCAGYSPSTDTLDFDVSSPSGTASGGTRTIVLTLLRAFVTKSAWQYDACFQSTLPFVTKSGAPATPSGGGTYTGLLPACNPKHPVAPCEVSTVKTRSGDIMMTLIAPPGDPRARF